MSDAHQGTALPAGNRRHRLGKWVSGGAATASLIQVAVSTVPDQNSPWLLGTGILTGVIAAVAGLFGFSTPTGSAEIPENQPAPIPPSKLPPINSHFVGRQSELLAIRQALNARHSVKRRRRRKKRQPPAACILHGMSGVGKTQLATRFAGSNRGDYTLVRWLHSQNRDILQSDLLKTATLLRIPEHEDPQFRLTWLWTWLRDNPGWLLVFDDVRAATDEPTQRWLWEFWPPEGAGHIVVTTQLKEGWDTLGLDDGLIEVSPLAPEDGIDFLIQRTAPDPDDADTHKQLSELGEALGWLPLALEQAGALIVSDGVPVEDYIGDLPTALDVTRAAGLTVELALERLRLRKQKAETLLRVCAFLAYEDIPRTMLNKNAALLPPGLREELDDPGLTRNSTALIRHSLLIHSGSEPTGITYALHPLIQLLVREALTPEERLRYAEAALTLVEAEFPDTPEIILSWSTYERVMPHVKSITALLTGGEGGLLLARLLHRVGEYETARCDWARARGRFERELSLYDRGFGDLTQRASAHYRLAESCFVLADLDRAAEQCELALTVCELLPEDEEKLRLTARCYQLLGGVRREQVRFDESLDAAREAVRLYEEHGERWSDDAWVRAEQEIGQTLRNAGRLREAEEHYVTALARMPFDASQEPQEYRVLRAMLERDKAIVAHDRGDLKNSEASLRHAHHVLRTERGVDDFETAQVAKFLADVLRQLGEQAHARGKATRRPLRRRRLHKQAHARYQEARILLGPVLALHRKRRKEEQHKYAACLNKLGSLQVATGDPAKALATLRKAEKVYSEVYGADHPYRAKTLSRTGPVLRALGQTREAVETLRKAEEIFRTRIGPDHPALIAVNLRLAATVSDPVEAAALRAEAARISAKHL